MNALIWSFHLFGDARKLGGYNGEHEEMCRENSNHCQSIVLCYAALEHVNIVRAITEMAETYRLGLTESGQK